MQFVNSCFEVPLVMRTDNFTLKPLSPEYAELDYKAIMSSIEHLKGAFGSSCSWPPGNLTLTQNKSDLGWHYNQFVARREFAYIVLDPDEQYSKGCVYIIPLLHPDYDVLVYSWVTANEAKRNFHEALINTVNEWLLSSWPFKRPVFPGITLTWDEWEKTLEI